MLEFVKDRGTVPVFAAPLGAWHKLDVNASPIGAFVFEHGRVDVVAERDPGDAALRDALARYGVEDALGLAAAWGRDLTPASPIYDMEGFDARVGLFLMRSVASLYNRHAALFEAVSPRRAPPDALYSEDILEILRLVKRGFRNAGEQTEETYVPFFTAFPLAQPAIAVSVTQSRKAAREASFKISLPGVSGGFSETSEAGITLGFGPSTAAIQFQRKMEARSILWRHKDSGAEVRSVSFRDLRKTRVTYDDGVAAHGYLPCRAPEAVTPVCDGYELIPNATGQTTPNSVAIGCGYSEAFGIELGVAGAKMELEVKSATETAFEIGYDLVGGYAYEWMGSRGDTHFIRLAARPL